VVKQQKCHYCSLRKSPKPGYTFITCRKCNVNLCLTKSRNYFLDFHNAD
jgi:hypothetical protein